MNETIIAVGNGGFNIARDLINNQLFPEAKLIVCDSSKRDMEKNSTGADESFLLERLRRKVTSSDLYLVEDIVNKTTDNVIICATFGGMTGSKYAPLIALAALQQGKFVSSIYSNPFKYEGESVFKRSSKARSQIIPASNFIIGQENECLKEIESLGLNDMNAPLIDTIKSLLSINQLSELANVRDYSTLQNYISEEFRVKPIPLIWIRSDTYRQFTMEQRTNIFDGKLVD